MSTNGFGDVRDVGVGEEMHVVRTARGSTIINVFVYISVIAFVSHIFGDEDGIHIPEIL